MTGRLQRVVHREEFRGSATLEILLKGLCVRAYVSNKLLCGSTCVCVCVHMYINSYVGAVLVKMHM